MNSRPPPPRRAAEQKPCRSQAAPLDFHVLLTDQAMRGLTGLEPAERARAVAAGSASHRVLRELDPGVHGPGRGGGCALQPVARRDLVDALEAQLAGHGAA